MRLAWLAWLAAAALVLGSGPAQAAKVEVGTKLARGETVTYHTTLDGGRRYVGGVTYTIVPTTPERLDRMLEDVGAYAHVLPGNRSARLVARSGKSFWVELQQGTSLIHGTLTLVFRWDDDNRTLRFWLDRSRPHDIEDAWGFFRAEPLADVGSGPRSLLTYGALLDVGPGFLRTFFEGNLSSSMLDVPQRIRGYVQSIALTPAAGGGRLALLPSGGADGAATR
jgi:hypothetical protein